MRPSPTALLALPTGIATLFEHIPALLLWPLLAGLSGLALVMVRWCADQPRRERERIVNQALRRIGQDDPERVLAWRVRLPPVASPFEREPSSEEGPAPPAVSAPPGDQAADSADGTA